MMALIWKWIFEGLAPDTFNVTGTAIALAGILAFIMFVYGILPRLQPSEFGRVNAAYGGIFIVSACLQMH